MVVAGDGAVSAAIRGPPDQRVGKLTTWCGAKFFLFLLQRQMVRSDDMRVERT